MARQQEQHRLLAAAAALLILAGWAVAVGWAAVNDDWHPVEVCTPGLLIVLGYIFGVGIVRKGGDGDG